jgi:hypothetical protein
VKHYAPKLFLAAAFALTLGSKLFFYHQGSAPTDPEMLGKTLTSFLLQRGFESRLERRFGQVLVHAKRGSCRMLIREAVPQGWNRSSIELQAKPVGRVRYVFDGAVYQHEPFVAPVMDEYWTMVRIKMGLSPSRHPLLAVAASDDCAINALPWWELGILS